MNAIARATDSEGLEAIQLCKVGEICAVLGLSQPTVYRLMESGELPYVRFGRARRAKKSDVLALIERKTVAR